MKKLDREFYKRDTLIVAQELLGKILVKKINNQFIMGRIVEVEAYKGLIDKAAHSYGGKVTNRNRIMYGDGGYAYVFLIYGMYYCMNIVTSTIGNPEAVLIRGIEPLDGVNIMSELRFNKSFNDLSKKEKRNLSNGPGKLCLAFNITKEENGMDMCGDDLYVLDNTMDPMNNINIATSKRINIDYAEEAKDFYWRFFIKDNMYVSKG
ncbi:DNA-3-methyladenine glycosylase [Clostridium amazonitimonense]|uniref:DNA-3-methyladenine glycosylase n=1 Tax=Clostridium amazonitimonense TaxID=1499689 RepID=UPI0005094CD7|nr:DNA-3-methyladenine glycosylase [Clostridium amazonitimonense]